MKKVNRLALHTFPILINVFLRLRQSLKTTFCKEFLAFSHIL